MKFVSKAFVFVCLGSVSLLQAQNSLVSQPAVSLYQLSHKPSKQAVQLCRKGYVQLNQRQYQAGVDLLKQALALDPDFWVAQNNLGVAYLKLAQNEEARNAFEQAVKIDPRNAIGYMNLSLSALRLLQYQTAGESARTALRLDPQLVEAKALLGLSQIEGGHWNAEARRLLEESYQALKGGDMILKKWPRANEDPPIVSLGDVFF